MEDTKVSFHDGKQEARTLHELRPGAIVVSPSQNTDGILTWVPGSTKIAGRAPLTTVIYQETALLLCYYEKYLPSTLVDKKDHLPAMKITELTTKWRDLVCA